MNTLQLDHTIKQLIDTKAIVKILPCDIALHYVNSLLIKPSMEMCCLTVNLDQSNKPGSHWISFLIDTKRKAIELFDSLAIHNFYPIHVLQIMIAFRRKRYSVKSNLRFQSLNSNCCGHYCALFFHHRLVLGIDFDTFCHMLNCQFPTFCARDCAVYESVYKLCQNKPTSPYIQNNPSEKCECIQICKQWTLCKLI